MAIKGYDSSSFGKKLSKLVYPAQPIHSIEHLFGRATELRRIEEALYASGRHVFIYGDRGVGKSSLAATAANQYQSSDSEYIDVSCSPDATLADVIANIAYQAISASRLRNISIKDKSSIKFKFLNLEKAEDISLRDLHDEIKSLLDAVEILREVSLIHSDSPVVVIDEFDRMESESERALFADLLKHLGDKRIAIKFIFTGVASTIDALLGAHQSAIRQLETIELPKLSWDARWEIVTDAAKAFEIEVDKDILVRIAAVSDGYPYYVHLITEKLMWHLFWQEDDIVSVKKEHYHAAINDAILSISAELKRPYEKAISQRTGDYEQVLWSTADSEWLHRYVKDMYSSYEYIMQKFSNKEAMAQTKYRTRIRNLKNDSCGAVLAADPKNKGMYSYREKMLRGYVRMQAEAHGIELIGEQAQEKTVQHATVRASSGYYQPSVPQGVYFDRERRHSTNTENET
ncbi:ATP-binding protein [Thalassotalea sp. G20_0]|uniref:ATP-binding protein n=1 Tax=Thalassotalea sp. G20_0 TaxID=2821093 RepID=UPI001AD9C8AB|nr:ATP-binding protein [Thalassotalea sp. G20_0]MBO9497248.1 ATP-binding protein [Thalassotalea sp. G20_0]